MSHRVVSSQLNMDSSVITDRKNSVLVDDKDAKDSESDWFSTKPTQKHI